jgi:predicted MPP superfamily phosphohydrolase
MSPLAITILIIGAIGHVVLWCAIVNRIHAWGLPRRWIDALTILSGLALIALPLATLGVIFRIKYPPSIAQATILSRVAWCYVGFCNVVLAFSIIQRLLWFRHTERAAAVLKNHTTRISWPTSAEPFIAPGIPGLLGRLPGNQVLRVCIHEKQIAIPRLKESTKLRIAHISDLHMSGRLARGYFEQIAENVNTARPDVIAITGDIIEREHCLNWIPQTLGQLRAPGGVYYVLGNHDLHVDESRLNNALSAAGLLHVGGTCRQIEVHGNPIMLAGNELPWYGPASSFAACPPHDAEGLPLRILLAHSPDQFAWAKANDVDLMLAGHLHGGQVRLPILGAILSPSRHGVRYAQGVFTAGNTVMHVSRGTGSLTPVRYNCPPEIAILTLVAKRQDTEQAQKNRERS